MLNEGYLSCIGRLNERLINFHKDILKNYLRPLGANPLGFLESYFGLRMFRAPGAEMLNLPEVEMIYLIQPMMNALSMEGGLNSEEKPSAYPSVEGQVKGLLLETRRKAVSGGSANLIKSFLPIYKHKYIPAFQDRIHSDSKTFSAARTAKSEIFTRRKEISFGRGKFDLTTPKGLDLLDHIPFPALQKSKMADADFKMSVLLQKKPVIPPFSANTHNLEQVHMHSNGETSFATDTVTPHPFPVAADIFYSWFKTQSRRPRSTRIYHGRSPAQPILHLERSSLRMHKFIPMIDTQHTRMKEDASFSSRLIFVDRHHNSSRSLKVLRVKENTNSRKEVKSYPISFEPSGLTAQPQHPVNYELIADRVYDIIENRLRIEKERE